MPAVTIHYNLSKRTVVQSAMKPWREALPMEMQRAEVVEAYRQCTSATAHASFCQGNNTGGAQWVLPIV